MRRSAASPGNRTAAILLIALALAMRVLIPAGFMLAPASGALPRLVICTGQGPMAMPAAHAGMRAMHHGKHDQNQVADHPCAFAAAGAAIELPALLPQALLLFVARDLLSRPLSGFARPGLGLAAPPPPKTGPPILA